MAADVSSVARLLRGEAGKKGGPEIVTMDLLGGCGGGGAAEDEVVDLEVTVPAGWERRLDLLVSWFPHLYGSYPKQGCSCDWVLSEDLIDILDFSFLWFRLYTVAC